MDGNAVAIVRLDRFDGGEVTVGGKPVTITLPDWATYRQKSSEAGYLIRQENKILTPAPFFKKA